MSFFPGDHFDGDDAYPPFSPKSADYFERYADHADQLRKREREDPPAPQPDDEADGDAA